MCSILGAFIFGYDFKIVVGGMGVLYSSLVALELLEKVADQSGFLWSPLRLMGPQPWIPIFNDVSRLIGIQIMIFAVLFCVSNVLLIVSATRSNHLLGIPFLVIYPCKMIYSTAVHAALYTQMYTNLDNFAAHADVGADLLIYCAVAVSVCTSCYEFRLRNSSELMPLITVPMV